MKGPLWSDEELSALRKLYPSAPAEALYAALPHRNKRAIKVQACKRRLHRQASLLENLNRPQISRYANVKFELDQIREIKDFARKRTISIAGAIQLLCEWGLEAERNQP